MPLFIDVGWLGSVTDVATLLYVVLAVKYQLKPLLETTSAALVALAENDETVDHESLQSDLDIEDRHVAAFKLPKRGEQSP